MNRSDFEDYEDDDFSFDDLEVNFEHDKEVEPTETGKFEFGEEPEDVNSSHSSLDSNAETMESRYDRIFRRLRNETNVLLRLERKYQVLVLGAGIAASGFLAWVIVSVITLVVHSANIVIGNVEAIPTIAIGIFSSILIFRYQSASTREKIFIVIVSLALSLSISTAVVWSLSRFASTQSSVILAGVTVTAVLLVTIAVVGSRRPQSTVEMSSSVRRRDILLTCTSLAILMPITMQLMSTSRVGAILIFGCVPLVCTMIYTSVRKI